ncbi:MAG: hypothetical protein ACM4AI_09385 [Acidobacteriota bacterium]
MKDMKKMKDMKAALTWRPPAGLKSSLVGLSFMSFMSFMTFMSALNLASERGPTRSGCLRLRSSGRHTAGRGPDHRDRDSRMRGRELPWKNVQARA